MKRILLLLLVAMILCGCVTQAPEETTVPTVETQPAVIPTEPAGCYLPDHTLERDTQGAVRVFAPEIPDAYAVAAMGSDLVIFSGTENTTLTKLAGENRFETAILNLNTRIDPADPSVHVSDKGMFYFDRETGELVQLGTGLKEISRIPLTEELVGSPLMSADRKRVYYCTAHSVWELTLETGINRMIKEVSEDLETVRGLLLEDTVLNCAMADGKQIFLAVENGKSLWQGPEEIRVCSDGENWYAKVPESVVDTYVFGREGETRMLIPQNFAAEGRYLEKLNLLMLISETENGVLLTACDLAVGAHCEPLTLDQLPQSMTVLEDRIWILAGSMLYSWAPVMQAETEQVTTDWYSLENPDPVGYAQCEAYAVELETRFGVEILFGAEAVAKQTAEYDLIGEYLVPVLLRELEKLEQALALYPQGMLQAAVEETTGGTLYLCLVRQVSGSAELGVPGNVGGTQFWDGSDCYVALAAGMAEHEWYRPLYGALETRLMSYSKACYDWEYLNPKGFDYDYNYILNQSRQDEGWLEGENRYFIDLFSMSFPREDRARIMEYAMMADCEAYFESDAMQAKLQALCLGLREAYGLKKSPETFLWEQYLRESLAYTK